MTSDKIKGHPSIIIDDSWLLVLIFVGIAIVSSMWTIFLSLSMATVAYYTILWKISNMEITPQGIVVREYRTERTIPYDMIAAVNTYKNIADRIFGSTNISISINSSMNALVPDTSFSFRTDIAEKIKSEIERRILNNDEQPEELEDIKSVISFSFKEIALHSMFGTNSYQLIYTVAMLGYSLFSILFIDGQGLILALILLFIGEGIPSAYKIIKYYNFKIYRKKDMIYVQHGAISLYETSFEIKRINYINIKETLFARIVKRASIEAEVIGLGLYSEEAFLCLLSKRDKTSQIIEILMPEFVEDYKYIKQPKSARTVMILQATIISLILVAIMSYPCFYAYSISPDHFSEITLIFAQYGLIFLTALIISLIFIRIPFAMKTYEYSIGSKLFSVIRGVLDKSTSYIQYDKVQTAHTSGNLIMRKFGLSRLTVKILSSWGQDYIKTGYFKIEDLEKVKEMIIKHPSDKT